MNPAVSLEKISPDALIVARAMALYWTWRPRSAHYNLVRQFTDKTASGATFTQEKVKLAQIELTKAGLIVEHGHRQGFWRLESGVRPLVYRRLLDAVPANALKLALGQAEGNPYQQVYPGYRSFHGDNDSVLPYLCLELFSGAPVAELQAFRNRLSVYHDLNSMLYAACIEEFDADLFERIAPEWRWDIAASACARVCDSWSLRYLPCLEWALEKLDSARNTVPLFVRRRLGMALLLRADKAKALAAVGEQEGGAFDTVRAAILAQEGQWAQSQTAFERAIKSLQVELGRRKNLLTDGIGWLYPLVLLAQQTPAHLALARKFCKAEAGPKSSSGGGWRIWEHVIAVRLGDEPINLSHF
ncbi:MAG: hypothetical protein ACKVQK_02565, partial [Burkholderiales bacterium]